MAESQRNTAANFWDRVEKTQAGCWVWNGCLNKDGYGKIYFSGKHTSAHRVAFEITNGPIPRGMCVCHTCDEARCVRPDHLFLGTHQQNIADRDTKRRTATGDRHGSRLHPELMPHGDRHGSKTKPLSILKGEKNPQAKLTEDQVTAIRATYKIGVTSLSKLADRFGVSIANVSTIVRRESWRHIA